MDVVSSSIRGKIVFSIGTRLVQYAEDMDACYGSDMETNSCRKSQDGSLGLVQQQAQLQRALVHMVTSLFAGSVILNA